MLRKSHSTSEFQPTKENALTPSCREPAGSLESTLTVLVQVLLFWSRHWKKCPETENCCSVLHLINTIELFFDYLPKKYAYWLNYMRPESRPPCECQLTNHLVPTGGGDHCLKASTWPQKNPNLSVQHFPKKIRSVKVWRWHDVVYFGVIPCLGMSSCNFVPCHRHSLLSLIILSWHF